MTDTAPAASPLELASRLIACESITPATGSVFACLEAMLEPLNAIIDAVRTTLERCPPELSADLVDRGIMLAGGGALLRGLDKLLQEETALPVHVAEDPLSAVGEGTGRVLSELEFLRKVSTTEV